MRETAIRVPGLYHASVTMVLNSRQSSTTRMKLQYQLSYTKSGTEYRKTTISFNYSKSGHWAWVQCPLFHISFLANWSRMLDSPLMTKAKMISFIMVYFHNDLITGQLLVGHLESERRVFRPIAMILLEQSLGTSAQLAAHWCHKARATSSKLRRVDSTS